MPQALANILVHTIFSTKHRQPFLQDRSLRMELHRYLGGILAKMSCAPVVVGGVEDHVHLLSGLARTTQPAEMVKELKRGSALWLKTKGPQFQDFAWQTGYGFFSIGASQIETTRRYIEQQEDHHHRQSFQDELREILKQNQVMFDERYVWD